MAVDKLGGATGNNPVEIALKIDIMTKEMGVTPIMTVDGADGTTTASSLQLLRTIGKAQYKAQAMHLLWGAGWWKYTLLLDDLRNEFLKGHNNFPAAVSYAYSLL